MIRAKKRGMAIRSRMVVMVISSMCMHRRQYVADLGLSRRDQDDTLIARRRGIRELCDEEKPLLEDQVRSGPRILLTAFEPFGGREINPSQVLLESLLERRGSGRQGSGERGAEQEGSRCECVEGLLLPVRLADAWPLLLARLDDLDPDVVLAMGEAGGREEINLETRAFNELDLRVPDNAGLQPRGERILEEGPQRLDSDLPLAAWVERLQAFGHGVRVSEDAGRHLCNMTLYRLLERQRRTGRPRAAFVHLPLLPEQLCGEEGEHSMSLEAQRGAMADLLDLLLTEPTSGS